MSQNGVVVTGERGWNQWVHKLMELARTGRELKFVIGDHLNRGEELYHDRIWQVLNDTGWSRAYIANVQYVARRITPDERTKEIGWSLYQSMAPLDKQERDKLITRALSGEVIHRDEIRAMRNGAASTLGNGASMAVEGVSASANGMSEERERVAQEFGQAMAVCYKHLSRGTDSDLKQALTVLVIKAEALREIL